MAQAMAEPGAGAHVESREAGRGGGGERESLGGVVLQAPPQLTRPVPQPLVARLMPVVMVLATVGIIAVMLGSGAARNPMTLMFPAMMAMSTVAMLVGSMQGGNRARETAEKRRDYLRHLDLTRGDLLEHAESQRAALVARHPAPEALAARLRDPRGGVDRPGSAVPSPEEPGLPVRFGLGTVPLSRPLVAPDSGPVDDLEPVSVAALRRLVRTHSFVHDAPVAVDLASYPVVSVYGEPGRVRALLRAVVGQIAVHAPPDVVRLAVCCGGTTSREAWDDVKWLPHAAHPLFADGTGAARLAESSLPRMEALLCAPPGPGEPHVIVVCDEVGTAGATWLAPGAVPGRVTLLEVCTTPSGALRERAESAGLALELRDGHDVGEEAGEAGKAAEASASGGVRASLLLAGPPPRGGTELLRPDALSRAGAAALFRLVARRHSLDVARTGRAASAVPPVDDAAGTTSFASLVAASGGRGMAALLGHPGAARGGAATGLWAHRSGPDRLRVGIGTGTGGAPVYLDLKESAEGGHGPHGLCVGATGSGKSEFLRAFVLGLVATHGPEQLNLVLVDFKGGATFAGLEGASHVAASITNLADEQVLVDRMREALEGELVRRQEILRAHGVAKAADYEAARHAAESWAGPALPALVIVVDEFSELLTARPDFAELFVQIGRLGRSLGIHLLLASQRLEEGRLRGLESHLSYRIALKTFSATESRVVLGSAEAYTLPAQPGAGFLKLDAGDPARFDAFYVSGPPRDESASPEGYALVPAEPRAVEFVAGYVPAVPVALDAAPDPGPGVPARPAGTSDWDLVAAGIAGVGPPAHGVWLPPLDGWMPLRSHDVDADREPPAGSVVRVPWAVVDLPFQQRRDILAPGLGTPEGNGLVVGAPRSGKSWALAAFALSAALRLGPDRLHLYGLDFGGGTVRGLDALPHAAGIAHSSEDERCRRILAELDEEMERRRTRAARREGSADVVGDSAMPRIVVLVDGWHAAKAAIDGLEARIAALATEGVALGVAVLVSASRWMDIRPAVRDALGTRLELRIADPIDSMLGREHARGIAKDRPGNGIIDGGHLVQVLVPECGPPPGTPLLDAAVAHTAERWVRRRPGAHAPRVRILPDVVRFPEIAALARPVPPGGSALGGLRLPVGIEERSLGPAYLDLEENPLHLVFGDAGSGKTSLLRTVATLACAMVSSDDLRILLVDYRRGLRGLVPAAQLAGHAANTEDLGPMVDHLVRILRERLAATDSVGAPRPGIVLLVDDADLLSEGTGNPLAPLVPFLAHARELGLALVLTRRVSGAARASFDPLVRRMRDLGATGLVLDGTKDEGALVGDVVARRMPRGRGQFHARGTGTVLWQLADPAT